MKKFKQIVNEFGLIPRPSPEAWDNAHKRAAAEFEADVPTAKKVAKNFKAKLKIHRNEIPSGMAQSFSWFEILFKGGARLSMEPKQMQQYFMDFKRTKRQFFSSRYPTFFNKKNFVEIVDDINEYLKNLER